MKYIVDIDALKDCIDLLPKPVKSGNLEYVCLQAVKEMIDKFPKDEYKTEEIKYKNMMKELANCKLT